MKGMIRFFLYLLLIAIFITVIWLLGHKAQGFEGILAFFAVALLGAIFLLPRSQCFILGGIGILLGVIVPGILWIIEAHARGDTSAYGMLGTILFILFAPIGIGLTITGWFKE